MSSRRWLERERSLDRQHADIAPRRTPYPRVETVDRQSEGNHFSHAIGLYHQRNTARERMDDSFQDWPSVEFQAASALGLADVLEFLLHQRDHPDHQDADKRQGPGQSEPAARRQ